MKISSFFFFGIRLRFTGRTWHETAAEDGFDNAISKEWHHDVHEQCWVLVPLFYSQTKCHVLAAGIKIIFVRMKRWPHWLGTNVHCTVYTHTGWNICRIRATTKLGKVLRTKMKGLHCHAFKDLSSPFQVSTYPLSVYACVCVYTDTMTWSMVVAANESIFT